MGKAPPAGQLSLLDWQPPEPVTRFTHDQVRAASTSDRVCRAIGASLADSPHKREEVAKRMGDFLGCTVSKSVLDAYASQARGAHNISVERFIALVHATQDRRLVQMLAELFGWAVIEKRFLKLIELAALQDREDELRRHRLALTRSARMEGML